VKRLIKLWLAVMTFVLCYLFYNILRTFSIKTTWKHVSSAVNVLNVDPFLINKLLIFIE
jgi:hypothetical protein